MPLTPPETKALEHAISLLNDPADQREQQAKQLITAVIHASDTTPAPPRPAPNHIAGALDRQQAAQGPPQGAGPYG